jgi:serine phosphatase RsbU (regulator of sigma subunit)
MDRTSFLVVCRLELRQIAISMVIGVAISTIYAMGQSNHALAIYAVAGAIVGFCIYAVISILSVFLRRVIGLLPQQYRVFAEGTKYMVGGAAGWLVGVTLANVLFGGRPTIPTLIGPARTFMLVTAGIALLVGLLFRSFELMEQRLRQREWAERELEIARSIQMRLLPPGEVAGDGFLVNGRNLPAHYVAGDFYDIVRLDDGSVMLVLADVAGKGIGAGLIMSSVKAVLPFLARTGVAGTMKALNQKLTEELGPREFVALVCARYYPQSGMVEIANGGCPDPYLLGGDGAQAIICQGVRLPLGVRQDLEYSIVTRRVEPGGRLLFLSDGIPEAPTGNGHPLGYDALHQIVDGLSKAPDRGAAWLDLLLGEVTARVGTTLSDDWTALVLDRSAD